MFHFFRSLKLYSTIIGGTATRNYNGKRERWQAKQHLKEQYAIVEKEEV